MRRDFTFQKRGGRQNLRIGAAPNSRIWRHDAPKVDPQKAFFKPGFLLRKRAARPSSAVRRACNDIYNHLASRKRRNYSRSWKARPFIIDMLDLALLCYRSDQDTASGRLWRLGVATL